MGLVSCSAMGNLSGSEIESMSPCVSRQTLSHCANRQVTASCCLNCWDFTTCFKILRLCSFLPFYLVLAGLGLARAFSSCSRWGLLFGVLCRNLTSVACCRAQALGLRVLSSCGMQALGYAGFSNCSLQAQLLHSENRIFLAQRSSPCPSHIA